MPINPFLVKAAKWKSPQFSMASTLANIVKESYQEESKCISIASEDQMYVTTGFKLTYSYSIDLND